MAKKIKADKFHVSRVCEKVELEAVMIAIKEEFDKLEIPQEVIDFDNDLDDLIVKHLMKTPIQKIEKLYGDHGLVDHTEDMINLEKKFPF